jgi:hypothetical protein
LRAPRNADAIEEDAVRKQSTIRIIALAALALACAPAAACGRGDRCDRGRHLKIGATPTRTRSCSTRRRWARIRFASRRRARRSTRGTGAVVWTGLTGGIQIDLGAGDDTLTLDAITSPGAVKLTLGSGDDTVTLTDATVNGRCGRPRRRQ